MQAGITIKEVALASTKKVKVLIKSVFSAEHVSGAGSE